MESNTSKNKTKTKKDDGIGIAFIDKDKLENALKLLNENNETTKAKESRTEEYCKMPIFLVNDRISNEKLLPNSYRRIFLEARNCLLKSDWLNLTKILIYLTKSRDSVLFFPIIKYTLISLLSDSSIKNTSLMKDFLTSTIKCTNTEEMEMFLKEVAKIQLTIDNPKIFLRLHKNKQRSKRKLFDEEE